MLFEHGFFHAGFAPPLGKFGDLLPHVKDAGFRVLAVCGPKRIGKSSILAQLGGKLVGDYLLLRVACKELDGKSLLRLL